MKHTPNWYLPLFLMLGVLHGCDCHQDLVDAPRCLEGEKKECMGPCGDIGYQKCVREQWSPCIDVKIPSPETCNGEDDDCDGYIDEDLNDTETCGISVGICMPGRYRCIQGKMVCVGGISPSKERCDGRDNDCNGLIDDIPEEVCYTGDPETRNIGICHAGIRRCIDGVSTCDFQQLPEPPRCGSGLDYDCDGRLDGLNSIDPTDVIFAVDMSCSMYDEQPRLVRALNNFLFIDVLNAPDRDQLHFALIAVPGELESSLCMMYSDLKPPDAFMQTMISRIRTSNSGAEPTFDCLLGIAHPNNPFKLSFRNGAIVKVILFTDEQCESPWCINACGSNCGQWSDTENYWPLGPDPRQRVLTADVVKQYMDNTPFEFYILTTKPQMSYYQALTNNVYPLLDKGADSMQQFLREHVINVVCE